eukprot:2804630-Alexandrium_andersonii.AAC.1
MDRLKFNNDCRRYRGGVGAIPDPAEESPGLVWEPSEDHQRRLRDHLESLTDPSAPPVDIVERKRPRGVGGAIKGGDTQSGRLESLLTTPAPQGA